jgi:hypothetical protein
MFQRNLLPPSSEQKMEVKGFSKMVVTTHEYIYNVITQKTTMLHKQQQIILM